MRNFKCQHNFNELPRKFSVDVTVENADVTLLHNMCFTDFNFSLMGRGIRMVIDFDRLNINGRHSTKTMTIGGRPVDGAGPMNIDLFDMEVTATALFDFIEPNSRMNITSISSTTRVTRATANLQGFNHNISKFHSKLKYFNLKS